MCWTSAKKPVLKTAKRNIMVKKVLDKYMQSPIYHFQWRTDKVYTNEGVTIRPFESAYQIIKYGRNWVIEDGLHSCRNIYILCWNDKEYLSSQPKFDARNFVLLNSGRFRFKFKVYDAVIPKGANYYVNEQGEYVSDRLMIKRLTQTPIETVKL